MVVNLFKSLDFSVIEKYLSKHPLYMQLGALAFINTPPMYNHTIPLGEVRKFENNGVLLCPKGWEWIHLWHSCPSLKDLH